MDQYALQAGMGFNGDLPSEIKFLYGSVVLRGPAVANPQYANYGSLFVLVPDDDPLGGTHTFPPFQGNGGGPSGGPIMTLKGRDIDLFMHLTGVRPGSVLAAKASYSVTKPDGEVIALAGQASNVGYYCDPADDFIVDQPGICQVQLNVIYDGLTFCRAGDRAVPKW
jgi:hypothetical protein